MAKKKYAILITLSVLFTYFSNGCESGIAELQSQESDFVNTNIISPSNNSEFSQSDRILFKAELIIDDNTVEFDSIRWDSNLIGLFNKSSDYSRTISSGEHIITCTIFKDSIKYKSNISIKVLDFIKIDTLYDQGNIRIYKIKDVYNYTIALDKSDKFFLGTENFGVIFEENNFWKSYNQDNGLKDDFIQTIAFDNNNLIHVGYMSFPSISKKTNEVWSHLPMDQFSIYQDVHNIAFDENNNLWAAFHFGEIVKYVNGNWEFIDNQPMKFHHPNSLFFDDEQNLWGSCEYGCFKFKNNQWELIKFNGELLEAFEFAIDKKGTIWALKNEILYKIENSEYKTYPASFFGNIQFHPYSIEVDLDDNVLLGTKTGIIKFDGTTWEKIIYPELSDKVILDIKIDSKNNIWFCTKTTFGVYFAN